MVATTTISLTLVTALLAGVPAMTISVHFFNRDTVLNDGVDGTLNLFLNTSLGRITDHGIKRFRHVGEWIILGQDDITVTFKADCYYEFEGKQ
ncbi:hypothetical protein [Nodosilinea nodulosa]|uniref:hypothetical protein n=1 Tax=Nodosilinea nodulosa TaxID=416001 RepID=UPI000474F409|nr:hypothetical protein [Nodosilinea nodulosa]